jgi:hypothetical protein
MKKAKKPASIIAACRTCLTCALVLWSCGELGGVLEKKAQSAGRKILPRVALQSAAFVSASVGFALDSKRPNSIRSFPNFGSLVNVPAIG